VKRTKGGLINKYNLTQKLGTLRYKVQIFYLYLQPEINYSTNKTMKKTILIILLAMLIAPICMEAKKKGEY
jgi:hypothetical protein